MDAPVYEQFRDLEESHWWFRGRRTVYLGLLQRYLGGRRVERALDLGCGMGGFLDGLSEVAERVFPADMAVEGLAFCRDRGYPLGVAVDGYALPYADASFDLVCLFDAVEHIADDVAVMAEVFRILKPGGTAYLTVPAYQFLYANNDRVSGHERRYTRGSLGRLLEGAGLEVVRNTHSNVLLFPVILPAVLGIKVIEAFVPPKADPKHTNLSWPIPAFVHDLLHAIFAAELPVSSRVNIPVGHSIAALARKPG